VAQYFNPLGAVHTFKPPALPEGMIRVNLKTLGQLYDFLFPFKTSKATLAFQTGAWLRQGLLSMRIPPMGSYESILPLMHLSRFPRPAL